MSHPFARGFACSLQANFLHVRYIIWWVCVCPEHLFQYKNCDLGTIKAFLPFLKGMKRWNIYYNYNKFLCMGYDFQAILYFSISPFCAYIVPEHCTFSAWMVKLNIEITCFYYYLFFPTRLPGGHMEKCEKWFDLKPRMLRKNCFKVVIIIIFNITSCDQ